MGTSICLGAGISIQLAADISVWLRVVHARVRSQVRKLGRNHNATPSTLGVLYFLLLVEGQGAHPRATVVRKQVWVCSADAGVCHALKAPAKVSKDIVYR